MQAYLVPCWWIGWWLWRAGCISQDTYLLYFISVQAFYHTMNYFLEDNKLAAIYVMLELNGINREIIFPRQLLGYSEYKNEKCLLLIVLPTIHIDICPTFIVTPHFTEECLCLSS